MCSATLKQYENLCYNDEIDFLSPYDFLCYNMVNNALELGGIKTWLPQSTYSYFIEHDIEKHIMTAELLLNLNVNRKVLYRNIDELKL